MIKIKIHTSVVMYYSTIERIYLSLYIITNFIFVSSLMYKKINGTEICYTTLLILYSTRN